jgi:hypothetical protein
MAAVTLGIAVTALSGCREYWDFHEEVEYNSRPYREIEDSWYPEPTPLRTPPPPDWWRHPTPEQGDWLD